METGTIYSILLIVHIVAGSASLFGAAIAILTKLFESTHKWHVFGGRIFFYGMTVVFLTALPMTLLQPNLFLLLIAIFSFYLAFNGWRRATNRKGELKIVDWTAILIMALAGTGMIIGGSWLAGHGDDNGFTLIVFGIIGMGLILQDYRRYKKGPLRGKERIRAHFTMMMAATIAAVTAFLVVNIQTNPVWIVWIAPTVVITPFIFWMNKRLYIGS